MDDADCWYHIAVVNEHTLFLLIYKCVYTVLFGFLISHSLVVVHAPEHL